MKNNKEFIRDLLAEMPKKATKKAAQIPEAERELFKAWQLEMSNRKHGHLEERYRPKIKSKSWSRYSNFIEEAVQLWAQLNNYTCNKVSTQGTYRKGKGFTFGGATKGVEDLQLFASGQMFAIEVKAGKDTVKPEQAKRREALRAQGFEYIIIHSLTEFLLWAQSKKL